MTEIERELRTAGAAPAAATIRDRGANALVLGFAGLMWFGWSQEGPPVSWVPFLVAGSALGAVVAIAALILTHKYRGSASAMGEAGGNKSYRRVVGTEVGAIAVGAAVLGMTGHAPYISPWILFIVGAHFLPLAKLFRIVSLRICGLLVAAAAVVATVIGLTSDILPSAVAGGGGGLLMVVFGAYSLQSGWRDHAKDAPRHVTET